MATYSAKVPYWVNQIKLGQLTYQQIVMRKPEHKANIDAYINKHKLTIDKTV